MRRFLLPNPPLPRSQVLSNRSWAQVAAKTPRLTGGFGRDKQPEPETKKLDDELFQPTRALFKIIKCKHHLENLLGEPPKSLKKAAKSLQSLLHPAFNNDTFASNVKSNADFWLSSTLSSLREHYSSVLSEARLSLSSASLSPDSVNLCTATATRWARHQLGKKLRDSVLDEALSLFLSSIVMTTPTVTTALAPQAPSQHMHRPLKTTEVSTQTSSPQPTCDVEMIASTESPQVPTPQVDHSASNTGDSTRRGKRTVNRKRIRPSSTPPSLSQLDLFGSPVPVQSSTGTIPKKTSPPLVTTTDKYVILADENFEQFKADHCKVLAHQNGKLSHFKSLLNHEQKPFPTVQFFLLALSLLDMSNSFLTNSSTLKSLLGAAHRVFPNAQLFVLLLGIDNEAHLDVRTNIQDLNRFVINKHPSSCAHIPAFPDFKSDGNAWSDVTKSETFSKIQEYLN